MGGKTERRREVAEPQVRAALGGLQSIQPHPSTKGDFRKLPRPFVPRRVRSSDPPPRPLAGEERLHMRSAKIVTRTRVQVDG